MRQPRGTTRSPTPTPNSFAAPSATLEGVGVSGYTAAVQYITSKPYLTAAASVLSPEARHASVNQTKRASDGQAPSTRPSA